MNRSDRSRQISAIAKPIAHADDAGYALTLFTVAFTFALLLVVGIVVDGGSILAERRQAITDAAAAARLGAAAVTRDGSGQDVIDQALARSEISSFLTNRGVEFDVAFECLPVCRSVVVTVRSTARLRILGSLGMSSRTVSATVTAHSARGTRIEEPATG
jgi:hypothetical protein